MGERLDLALVEELKVFAVIRTADAAQALAAAEACLRGGIRLLEITLTVPGALGVVERLAARPEAVIGVGSVCEPSQVEEGSRAGARFCVSPHFDGRILESARARGLFCSMGGVTATEAMTSHAAGVDVTKVFPASAFGGPAYLRSLRAPAFPAPDAQRRRGRVEPARVSGRGRLRRRPGRKPGGPQGRRRAGVAGGRGPRPSVHGSRRRLEYSNKTRSRPRTSIPLPLRGEG